MRTNSTKEIFAQLTGKSVSEIEIADDAIVLKFEDNTFLDIYLDSDKLKIITYMSKM